MSSRLPIDILVDICCFLDRPGLRRIQLTSRKHRDAVAKMGRATPLRFIRNASLRGYEVEINGRSGKAIKSEVSGLAGRVNFMMYALQHSRLRILGKPSTLQCRAGGFQNSSRYRERQSENQPSL